MDIHDAAESGCAIATLTVDPSDASSTSSPSDTEWESTTDDDDDDDDDDDSSPSATPEPEDASTTPHLDAENQKLVARIAELEQRSEEADGETEHLEDTIYALKERLAEKHRQIHRLYGLLDGERCAVEANVKTIEWLHAKTGALRVEVGGLKEEVGRAWRRCGVVVAAGVVMAAWIVWRR